MVLLQQIQDYQNYCCKYKISSSTMLSTYLGFPWCGSSSTANTRLSKLQLQIKDLKLNYALHISWISLVWFFFYCKYKIIKITAANTRLKLNYALHISWISLVWFFFYCKYKIIKITAANTRLKLNYVHIFLITFLGCVLSGSKYNIYHKLSQAQLGSPHISDHFPWLWIICSSIPLSRCKIQPSIPESS